MAKNVKNRNLTLPNQPIPQKPGGVGLATLADIAWSLLFFNLLLTPLLFSTWTLETFEFPKVSLLLLVALTLVGLGLAAWTSGRSLGIGEFVRQPMAWGFLLLNSSALLSTLFSLSPLISWRGAEESFSGLGTIIALEVLFVATWILGTSSESQRWLLLAPVLAAGIATLYALMQFYGIDPLAWETVSLFHTHARPFSTLGHPNHLGAYLALVFPVGVYFFLQAWQQRNRPACVSLGVLGLCAGLAVFLAFSRASWFGMMVGLAFFGIVGAGRQRRGLLVRLCLAVLILVILGLYFLRTWGPPDLATNLNNRLQRVADPSGRLAMWKTAWAIFGEAPLLGSGLDTFQMAFARHRNLDLWQVEWGVTPNWAHNGPLQVLATQGLLGMAAIVILGVGLVTSAFQKFRMAESSDRTLRLALMAGLVGYLIQFCFSFTLSPCGCLLVTYAALLCTSPRPLVETSEATSLFMIRSPKAQGWLLGISALLVVLVFACNFITPGFGIGKSAILPLFLIAGSSMVLVRVFRHLLSKPPKPAGKLLSASRPLELMCGWGRLAGSMVLVGGLATWFVLRPLAADLAGRHGHSLTQTAPNRAVGHLNWAVTLDPSRPILWLRLGEAAGFAADQAVDRQSYLNLARTSFQQACRLTPLDPAVHLNLGHFLTRMARDGLVDPSEAHQAFDTALKLDPLNVVFWVEVAEAALALGDFSRTQAFAEQADKLFPGLGPPRLLQAHAAGWRGNYAKAGRLSYEASERPWKNFKPMMDPAHAFLALNYWKNAEFFASQLAPGTLLPTNLRKLDEVEDPNLNEYLKYLLHTGYIAETFLQSCPQAAQFQLLMARSLERVGFPGLREKAILAYRKYLDLNPQDHRARASLAFLEGLGPDEPFPLNQAVARQTVPSGDP